MLINEFENFLHQTFCAFILNVTFGRCQQRTNRVHINAALYKASTGSSQFLQTIVVGCIHDAQQCPWLQCHATRMDVLDQLTKNVWFEFLNNQRLMGLPRWLSFGNVHKMKIDILDHLEMA